MSNGKKTKDKEMEQQQIYGLVSDHGDGSASMRWFRSKDLVDAILERADDDEDILQEFYGNEGFPSQTLTFPADLDLDAAGFYFDDDMYNEDGSLNDSD